MVIVSKEKKRSHTQHAYALRRKGVQYFSSAYQVVDTTDLSPI